MWYLLYKHYWFKWFSHRFICFQLYRAFEEEGEVSNALWSPSPTVSKRKRARHFPFSVMLTGPHCQSDRAAHQTSAPTPLSHTEGVEEKVSDNLTGEMRRLHQIINTHTDRRQSVPGEPFFTPNISYRDETTIPLFFLFLISAPLSRDTFPADGAENQPAAKWITPSWWYILKTYIKMW